MEDSILLSIKKLLGLDEGYDAFDLDVTIHINSAFFTLNQVGIGPEGGYSIQGPEDQWFDFTKGRFDIEAVKTYVYLKVRNLFDPPDTSYAREAFKKQAEEYEWRLLVQSREST